MTVTEQENVRFAKGTRRDWLQRGILTHLKPRAWPSTEGCANTWRLQDEVPEKVKPKFNETRRHGGRTESRQDYEPGQRVAAESKCSLRPEALHTLAKRRAGGAQT